MSVVRLILLNGPPGIGKSTLARRYADDHPLALNLDIDLVRGQIGGWMDDQEQSGAQARRLALAMARVHLLDGLDVVVPQLLARAPFIEQLEALAADVGVPFVEIVLMDGRSNALARFAARPAPAPGSAFDPNELAARNGGIESIGALYDLLVELVATRPSAVVIPTAAEAIEPAYAAVLDALGDA